MAPPGTLAHFDRAWSDLRTAVAGLAPEQLDQFCGCRGWLVRDLVCHLVVDAQDVLITLATPSADAPTADAVTYWEVLDALPMTDPLAALTVRLAKAYENPALLQLHLDDLGAAAGRAAALADSDQLVGTQGKVLSVGDYLHASVLEWTLHHLDLVAHLDDVAGPDDRSLAEARMLLESVLGEQIPESLDDADALRVATGRRDPTDDERAALPPGLAARLPVVLG